MFQSMGKHEKQPVRKSSFWGIRCESGKKYSQIVNQKYHISMAALDPTSVKNGKEVVSLVVERDGSEFLLCNLQKDSVLQVNLNLFFDKGEKVVFSLKGQGIVHLTGYLIKDENDQGDERLKRLNDSIMLAKDKIKASAEGSKHVHFNKNVSTFNDSWKVESKDKSSISPIKNSASPKKSSISPSNKSPQKQLFKAAEEESEESSSDDDDDDKSEESEDENMKRLRRIANQELRPFANKRPLATILMKASQDNFQIDSSDESDEELPAKNKERQEPQSNKKLKLQTSTPLGNKKSVSKNVSEVIEIDDSKNQDMNSSIGRTPMPKKKQESKLQQKGSPKESKQSKPKDEESSDSNSDDEMETSTSKASETDKNKSASQLNTSSEALGSEKKKKKKKKKKSKANNSTSANESNASGNDTSFTTDNDLLKLKFSKTLPGGVMYEDLRLGNGPIAKKGRMVHVFYVGKLENNKMFDTSLSLMGKPFVFKLGVGQVIKGWDLAIEGMRVGGKRRIKVPPNMAYKNKQTGPVPPNSTLYFVVDLKAVS